MPMPVSRMSTIRLTPYSSRRNPIRTLTPPSSVNLIEFSTKIFSTWEIFSESPISPAGTFGSMSNTSSRCWRLLCRAVIVITSFRTEVIKYSFLAGVNVPSTISV